MDKICNEVIKFTEETMKSWRIELTAGGNSLAKAKIQRGIFQGDALSLLLFVIAVIPPNHILTKCSGEYKLHELQEKINYLTYWDEIKLLIKNEKELKSLIQAMKIYSEDIGMEFGIEKCSILIIKEENINNGRNTTAKSRKNQKARRKENLQILGNIGSWHRQTSGDERKNFKRISQGNEKTTRNKTIYNGNLIKSINTWTVPLVRYSGSFLI